MPVVDPFGVLRELAKEPDFETRLANLTEQGRIIGIMQTKILVAKLILDSELSSDLNLRNLAHLVLSIEVPPETAL